MLSKHATSKEILRNGAGKQYRNRWVARLQQVKVITSVNRESSRVFIPSWLNFSVTKRRWRWNRKINRPWQSFQRVRSARLPTSRFVPSIRRLFLNRFLVKRYIAWRGGATGKNWTGTSTTQLVMPIVVKLGLTKSWNAANKNFRNKSIFLNGQTVKNSNWRILPGDVLSFSRKLQIRSNNSGDKLNSRYSKSVLLMPNSKNNVLEYMRISEAQYLDIFLN